MCDTGRKKHVFHVLNNKQSSSTIVSKYFVVFDSLSTAQREEREKILNNERL